jgi:hypothetical protein
MLEKRKSIQIEKGRPEVSEADALIKKGRPIVSEAEYPERQRKTWSI